MRNTTTQSSTRAMVTGFNEPATVLCTDGLTARAARERTADGATELSGEFFEYVDMKDGELDSFETVLVQPETKRRQKVYLNDLALPARKLAFRPESLSAAVNVPLVIERPRAGEGLALTVDVPAGKELKLYIFERETGSEVKPEMTPSPASAGETAGKPAVFVRALVERDASLEVVYLHPFHDGSKSQDYLKRDRFMTCLYHVKVAQNANFRWTSVNFGDSLLEKGLVELNGRGASTDIAGAAYIPTHSLQEYQNLVVCEGVSTRAKMLNHGVVEDFGEGSFASIADIKKGASGAAVREDNRFITLGDAAKANADPTLLIDEADVQASHAATVGQMDEETMYYLRSRGLTAEQAKRLVTVGFLNPLLDRIDLPELREEIRAFLTDKVNHTERRTNDET